MDISDLTFDDVIAHLLAGDPISTPAGARFALENEDSRVLLAFYARDRSAYWNPDRDKNIVDGEIDQLLAALDSSPPTASPPVPVAQQTEHWRLTKIEAHRFRGLHRHCGAGGADPDIFLLDLAAPITMIRGFNGAGKTSLMSAICWCLTGYGHRSQGLPSPLHEPIPVKTLGDAEFSVPAVAPVPTESELAAVGGAPKLDSWVRLTFESLADARPAVVERRLEREGRKNFKTEVTGLDALGLSNLALQVGTLMPALAAATRFNDKTDLSQAVSTLTGLRPLAHFGKRSARLHDHLTVKYPKLAEEAKTSHHTDAASKKQTLADLLAENSDLPDLDCIVLPRDTAPQAWRASIDEAEARLLAVEEQAARDAEDLLGDAPSFDDPDAADNFADMIESARGAFRGQALRGLPSMQLAARLGEIGADALAQCEEILSAIEAEAHTLATRLSDGRRAIRLQLYGLVAKWHHEHHSGESLSACPVCSSDLADGETLPYDTLLGLSVMDALEQARSDDAALLKSAAEWERDTCRGLANRLPEPLRPFLSGDVPASLALIYKRALSDEVFAQREFPKALRRLSAGIAALCDAAWTHAPSPAQPSADGLPSVIPDREGLRRAIANVRAAMALAKYRADHADLAQSAMQAVLQGDEDESARPVRERSVKGQLAILSAFVETARRFAGLRRQLTQYRQSCSSWEAAHDRNEKLARAARAVEPFLQFPDLVHDQVAGLIAALEGRASHWAEAIYRAHFVEAPSYAGLDAEKADGFTFLAAHGTHRVEAHQVMNASALRAYLTAFVIALWEQLWSRGGGLTIFLLDDPQDLLDPGNVANFAAAVPRLVDAGLHPLIVSNDFGFIPACEAHAAGRNCGYETLEISAISTSKCRVSHAPVPDEVRARRDRWLREDVNDVALARAFVHPVRVRIEIKLWDLLASDPVMLHDPTLGDLLGKIATMRNTGQRPFDEEPFQKLLALDQLKSGAAFREIINRAHHGKADQITPADAVIVRQDYEKVLEAIDACWLAWARFMGRLPADQRQAAGPPSPLPNVVQLPMRTYPVIGRLAAREVSAPLILIDGQTGGFELASLGDISLFTLRAATLGLVAFPGQTLIVSLGEEAKHGDLAVVEAGSKMFARRLGVDASDLARIALETMPSANPRVPPTHFLKRANARCMKILGVLFDETDVAGARGEAVAATGSSVLADVIAVAEVAGDSAYPVARNRGHVLLARASAISQLEGRIVAVSTRSDVHSTDHMAYLKRLGKKMPGQAGVYYLENVGQSGEGEFVQFAGGGDLMPDVPIVDHIWKVVGTLF